MEEVNYIICSFCRVALSPESFSRNRSRKRGRSHICKVCTKRYNEMRGTNKAYYRKNANRIRGVNAAYRARQVSSVPAWADTDAILQFYLDCPPGHQVDHIIPLQGELVQGLHVLENLQYLTPEQNMNKQNHIDINKYKR